MYICSFPVMLHLDALTGGQIYYITLHHGACNSESIAARNTFFLALQCMCPDWYTLIGVPFPQEAWQSDKIFTYLLIKVSNESPTFIKEGLLELLWQEESSKKPFLCNYHNISTLTCSALVDLNGFVVSTQAINHKVLITYFHSLPLLCLTILKKLWNTNTAYAVSGFPRRLSFYTLVSSYAWQHCV